MALWKVTPDWKKSIVERSFWVNTNDTSQRVVQEIGWRWGEFIVATETDEPPEIDEDTDLFCDDFELQDWSTDDGCWEETDIMGLEEDAEEELQEFLSENSIFDLEERGWTCDESEMYITCTVTIEKIED